MLDSSCQKGKHGRAIPPLIYPCRHRRCFSIYLWAPDEKSPASDQNPVNIEPRAKPTEKAEAPLPKANIRVDTTVVLIPVTVTDPLNRFVTGLEKENFKISEDKVEQKIRQFSSEDAPLSVGLVFDTSGSMGSKLEKSRQAVAEFLKTMNPDDESFLVEFNDRAELALGFTRSPGRNSESSSPSRNPKGGRRLLDAVYMALHTMKKAHNSRKALLIISDGGDNSSRYTETEIKNLVREADVQIYAIGIFEPVASRGRTAEEMGGPGLLQEISEQTGGRAFGVENLAELPDIAAKIGLELRNQYILGYSPSNRERDGKYRKVKVTLVQPKSLPPLKRFLAVWAIMRRPTEIVMWTGRDKCATFKEIA